MTDDVYEPYEVQWGETFRAVSTVDELTALLDEIADARNADGAGYTVFLTHTARRGEPQFAEWGPPTMWGTLGHPSGLGWVLRDEHGTGHAYGIAYDPAITAPPEPENEWDWAWDWGGQTTSTDTWKVRLRTETVKALLLSFISGEDVPGIAWGLTEP